MMLGEIEDSRKSFKKILERKRIPWQARRYRRCRFYAFVERIVEAQLFFVFIFFLFQRNVTHRRKSKEGNRKRTREESWDGPKK